MTMKNKLSSIKKIKKSKKGFTVLELIIVIAVLAILAAIAIPVITTTINSAKRSAMESDRETLETLIKTAVTEMQGGVQQTFYNDSAVGPSTDLEDIMTENNLGDVQLERIIGGKNYYMIWNGKNIEISETSTHQLTESTTLSTLCTSVAP